MGNRYCECDIAGELDPRVAHLYDKKTELPFVEHLPGKCGCVNDLRLYRRADGSVKMLCSICYLPRDVEIRDKH